MKMKCREIYCAELQYPILCQYCIQKSMIEYWPEEMFTRMTCAFQYYKHTLTAHGEMKCTFVNN